MSSRSVAILQAAVLSVLCFWTPQAAAQVVIYNFTGHPNDGQGPVGSLLPMGSAFFGMTNAGGSFGDGTIFRTNPDGTGYVVLHNFGSNILTDGLQPFGTLVQSGGILYGITSGGGSVANAGTVFSINPDNGAFNIVHAFKGGVADGFNPLGSPTISGGVMYGMTQQGGTANKGTVWRMNLDGTGFQVIHSFTDTPGDGGSPGYSKLVVSGNSIYGMTPGGGISPGFGMVFGMSADGTGFTMLHGFNAPAGDGWVPTGSLTLVGNTLYGMTDRGGASGLGTIFQLKIDGSSYSRMRDFAGSPTDGAFPAASELFYDGARLYGSTPQGGAYGVGSTNPLGVLFGIDPGGSNYDVLASFPGGLGGGGPTNLIEYNGSLYGMTAAGGSAGDGTIFSFPISVPEPSSFLLTGLTALALAARERRRLRLRAARQANQPSGSEACGRNGS